MSLQRLTAISIVSANHMNGQKNAEASEFQRPPIVPVHGVNVVLGGAMMSGIIIMVFLICYCCHRNQQKRQNNLPHYWRDPSLSVEVYTVDGQQLYEIPEEVSRPVMNERPPSYEAAVLGYHDKGQDDLGDVIRRHDESGLPSYEAALRLAHSDGRIV